MAAQTHAWDHETDTTTHRRFGRIVGTPEVWCWTCGRYLTRLVDSEPKPAPGTLPELAEWEAQQAAEGQL